MRNISLVSCLLCFVSLLACNSGTIGGGDQDLGADVPFDLAGVDATVGPNLDAIFYQDPPLMYCGVDGGTTPPPPTGTAECPSDKNREGCPCPKVGDKAPCWPGLRKNRALGQCKDGETTCTLTEIAQQWGPCVGFVLPTPGATSGAAACNCFSRGQWSIENLSPCFFGSPPGRTGAVSTQYNAQTKMYECPGKFEKPAAVFSPNTVRTDCTGHFRLCYALRAGKVSDPKPGDCTVIKVCTESDVPTADTTVTFPALPSWITTTAAQQACAEAFASTGGYGEMSVQGKSTTCDPVGDPTELVFHRIGYCKLGCQPGSMDPECKGCMNGGSGMFP